MGKKSSASAYFLLNIQISQRMWERLRLSETLTEQPAAGPVPEIILNRRIADRLNRLPERSGRPVPAGQLHLYGLLIKAFRFLIDRYTEELQPRSLEKALESRRFCPLFSGTAVRGNAVCRAFPRCGDRFAPGECDRLRCRRQCSGNQKKEDCQGDAPPLPGR